jgi:hypothetical protein
MAPSQPRIKSPINSKKWMGEGQKATKLNVLANCYHGILLAPNDAALPGSKQQHIIPI